MSLPNTRTENAADRLSAMLATVDKLRVHTGMNDAAHSYLDGVAAGIEAAADVCNLVIVSWFADEHDQEPQP